MKIRSKWFISFLVLFIIFIASIILYRVISSSGELLKNAKFSTGNRNFSVAYDKEKKLTLIGTYDNKLIAYDDKGKEVWEFTAKGPIREIKIDEKNRKAYVGSEDTNIYILGLDKGEKQKTIEVERRIYSIDINRDASLIAVSAGINAFKHKLLLYQTSGKPLWDIEIGVTSRKVAFSSDSSKIFLGTDTAMVFIYDLKGTQLKMSKMLDTRVVDLKVDQSSSRLLVLTEKCTSYTFDENLNQLSASTQQGTGLSIGASKDLMRIGIGTNEGNFYLTDELGKVLYKGSAPSSITGILFGDRSTYITGMGDFVYVIDNSNFTNINLLTKLSKLILIFVFIIPIFLFVLLVLSFEILSKKATEIGKILYKHRMAYLLLLPTITLLLIFNYYPVFTAFTRAFTDWSINSPKINFNGLDNFKLMLSEGYFLTGLKNLAILLITGFIKILTVPLLIAELVFLMRRDGKKYWFRFLFVVPMVVPGIVGTLMWANMYDPQIGLVNQLLHGIGLDSWKQVWLGDPRFAIWAIVFMGFPFVDAFAFLVYYGGLINIPGDLFEAAKVDGITGFKNFTRLHLPLITPQFKMLIVLSFIGAIQNYMPILILTGGGPGSDTYVPGLELFYNATRFGRYGYACALGVILFIAVMIGTILNLKIKTYEE